MQAPFSLNTVPENPGVYQFLNAEEKIIYIGKAKNLRKRVASYFVKKHEHGKTRVLVKNIAGIKFIVVDNETDALLLENNLIKKYQPRYNVLLKDDKSYPWICIKNEPFPRVFSTRNLVKDGSSYYGPYTSVKMVSTLLDLIRQLYKVRTCNYHLSKSNIEQGKFKVCLEYHIGNCLGPCEGKQQVDDYDSDIDEIRQIIKGNTHHVIKHLKGRMLEFSESLEFEKAQMIKGKIEVLEKYQSKSVVVNPAINNVDVCTLVMEDNYAFMNYLRVINGGIVQAHTLEMQKKLDETEQELIEIGLIEMRERFQSDSKEVLVSVLPENQLEGVHYHVPQRGDKKHLLDLSLRNATYFLMEKRKKLALINPDKHTDRILNKLKDDLRMKELPKHIECFDNSNIQGANPVAACVVFKNAKPSKRDYRHFNIKTVEGPNDFASMEEVVFRRYSRLLDENEPIPQLVVIDGGKGQLSSAVKSLDKLGLMQTITVIGIAKKLEEIYFPGDSIPIYLDKRSESLKLIQHLRNEAHRFGITHHRSKRSKEMTRSVLTDIPGVGFRTAQQLLWKFKSVEKVKAASLEELETAVNKKQAKAVFEYFFKN
jgi:excinuclease ABC subunit C